MFELGDLDRAPSLGGSDQRTEHQLQDGSLAERVQNDLEMWRNNTKSLAQNSFASSHGLPGRMR